MAKFGSTLLPRGLSLCFLMMLFVPANCANDTDSCMFFREVVPAAAPGIKANSDVYESSTIYTISVPVNNNIHSVVFRAVDMRNHSVGLWHNADQYCNGSSVLYRMRDPHSPLLTAYWESPRSMNGTAVMIQAFTVSFHKVATFSHLMLSKRAMTTVSPFMIPTTRPTTARSLTTTRSLTTAQGLATTRVINTATTRSLANRIFLSPIADATQILLVFLTSKLLF